MTHEIIAALVATLPTLAAALAAYIKSRQVHRAVTSRPRLRPRTDHVDQRPAPLNGNKEGNQA